MKGIKTAEFANSSSKRFHSDLIIAKEIMMPDGIEVYASLKKMIVENQEITQKIKTVDEENKKLNATIVALEKTVQELKEKVNSFEVEES